MSSVLLCHPPTYSLETGSLTKREARPVSSIPQESPVSVPLHPVALGPLGAMSGLANFLMWALGVHA